MIEFSFIMCYSILRTNNLCSIHNQQKGNGIMRQTYTPLKVNNEIELCEVRNEECKKMIEKALLQNRISYFVRWTKSGLLFTRREHCTICINENAKEEAVEIVRTICEETGYKVKFLLKPSQTNYL